MEEVEAVAEQFRNGGTTSIPECSWQRDNVNWRRARPKLFGLQSEGAAQVDFVGQIGVYLFQPTVTELFTSGAPATRLYRGPRSHLRTGWVVDGTAFRGLVCTGGKKMAR